VRLRGWLAALVLATCGFVAEAGAQEVPRRPGAAPSA
jgi:hypothetical protein